MKARAKTEMTSTSPMMRNPEYWRQHAKDQEKNVKVNRDADMTTYNPISVSYNTFDQIKKTKNKNLGFLAKNKRFKTENYGSGLSPMKYNISQEWRGKDTPKTLNRHGLESISKGCSKSAYYH